MLTSVDISAAHYTDVINLCNLVSSHCVDNVCVVFFNILNKLLILSWRGIQVSIWTLRFLLLLFDSLFFLYIYFFIFQCQEEYKCRPNWSRVEQDQMLVKRTLLQKELLSNSLSRHLKSSFVIVTEIHTPFMVQQRRISEADLKGLTWRGRGWNDLWSLIYVSRAPFDGVSE